MGENEVKHSEGKGYMLTSHFDEATYLPMQNVSHAK